MSKYSLRLWATAEFIHQFPHAIVCYQLPGKKVFSHFVETQREAAEWEKSQRGKHNIPLYTAKN